MPYWILKASSKVHVTAPGSPPVSNAHLIAPDMVETVGQFLAHGDILDSAMIELLVSSDVQGAEYALAGRDGTVPLKPSADSPHLPPVGTWEYKVVPVTEAMGFGTARGTAGRMQHALNTLAADGWELVGTADRDSRWIGGETMMLTMRRFVVTEHAFKERFRAEERLRRSVIAELDVGPPATS